MNNNLYSAKMRMMKFLCILFFLVCFFLSELLAETPLPECCQGGPFSGMIQIDGKDFIICNSGTMEERKSCRVESQCGSELSTKPPMLPDKSKMILDAQGNPP